MSNHIEKHIKDLSNLYPITVDDLIAELNKNNLPFCTFDFNLIKDKLNEIFTPIHKYGFSLCKYNENNWCFLYAQSAECRLMISSSNEKYSNTFNIIFKIKIDFNEDTKVFNINFCGEDVYYYILKNNTAVEYKCRSTIFKTHCGSSLIYNINSTHIEKLIAYMYKQYKNIINDNEKNYKNTLSIYNLRKIDCDSVNIICDTINNHNDWNIYAHFFDDGKEDFEDKYLIVINNRNTYNDLPQKSYEYLYSDVTFNECELASLTYFATSKLEHINLKISKIKKENKDAWMLDVVYPTTNLIKTNVGIINYSTYNFDDLYQMSDFIDNILKKDHDLYIKMKEQFGDL